MILVRAGVEAFDAVGCKWEYEGRAVEGENFKEAGMS